MNRWNTYRVTLRVGIAWVTLNVRAQSPVHALRKAARKFPEWSEIESEVVHVDVR